MNRKVSTPSYLSFLYQGDTIMRLENYEVHLPNYSIGDHIYDRIGPVCESYGKTVLIIGGKKALEAAYQKIRQSGQQRTIILRGVVSGGMLLVVVV